MSLSQHVWCSICLLWASWNNSAERSNLALSCSILFSQISIKELCQSWVVLSGTSRRLLFPLRPLFSCLSFSAFVFSLFFWTSVTLSGSSDSLGETFTLGSEVKVELPSIAILDRSMQSPCPITSFKMLKQGKPSLIFLIPASPVEWVHCVNCLYSLSRFCCHFFTCWSVPWLSGHFFIQRIDIVPNFDCFSLWSSSQLTEFGGPCFKKFAVLPQYSLQT